MRKRITAGFKHLSSNDEHHDHESCPTDEDSYCFYNAALAKGETPKSHEEMKVKCHLSAGDAQKVLGVYEDLTRDELLQKCISGRTQNPNESLHAKVWSKLPKHKQFGLDRVEALAALTVTEHNMGYRHSDVMGRLVSDDKSRSAQKQQNNRDYLRMASATQHKVSKKKGHRAMSHDDDYSAGGH
jgi:hypothetical protein